MKHEPFEWRRHYNTSVSTPASLTASGNWKLLFCTFWYFDTFFIHEKHIKVQNKAFSRFPDALITIRTTITLREPAWGLRICRASGCGNVTTQSTGFHVCFSPEIGGRIHPTVEHPHAANEKLISCSEQLAELRRVRMWDERKNTPDTNIIAARTAKKLLLPLPVGVQL